MAANAEAAHEMSADPASLRLRLENFRPMTRSTLRGFATITIEPIGLMIDDICVHQSDAGGSYALLPSKPQVKWDGTVMRRDDGKVAYSPILKFSSREGQDRFSHGVVELVRRRFPGALIP